MEPSKVSIIVTSYRPESKKYLDLCIESVKNLAYSNFETIIVGRKPDYLPQYEGCKTVAPEEFTFWNSRGLNFGAQCAASDSEFFFMINDDVVLTKNCLNNLVFNFKAVHGLGMLMPVGNDQMGAYCIPGIAGKFHHETVLKNKEIYLNWDPSHNLCGTFFQESLCMYAVLIHRSVFEMVGPFDESLIGWDDTDYSWRVRQAGLRIGITPAAFVWHFGGVSADHTLNNELREKGKAIFNKKWGIK